MVWKEAWEGPNLTLRIKMKHGEEGLDGPGLCLLRHLKPEGFIQIRKYTEHRAVLEGRNLMKLSAYLQTISSQTQILELLAQLALLPFYLEAAGFEARDILWREDTVYVHLWSHQLFFVYLPIRQRQQTAQDKKEYPAADFTRGSYPVFARHVNACLQTAHKEWAAGLPGDGKIWPADGRDMERQSLIRQFEGLRRIHPGLEKLCAIWYGSEGLHRLRGAFGSSLLTEADRKRADLFDYYSPFLSQDMACKSQPTLTWMRTRQRFYISKSVFRIGKSKEMDLSLPDAPSISRVHAQIRWKEEGFFVQDLHSKNGTYVAGHLLLPRKEAFLGSGQELMLGAERFIFEE